jgi:hypothetical protein
VFVLLLAHNNKYPQAVSSHDIYNSLQQQVKQSNQTVQCLLSATTSVAWTNTDGEALEMTVDGNTYSGKLIGKKKEGNGGVVKYSNGNIFVGH